MVDTPQQADGGRALPAIPGRLIVALDLDTVDAARAMAHRLDGVASFFKIGLGLFCQRGVDALIDELIQDGKRIFLDYKMYDIGETVRRGVASVARRNIDFLTVHGDPEIMKAAVDGRGESGMKIFAVSVLTSLDDAALRAMGYDRPVSELIRLRVQAAARSGCDGVIASASDAPDALRTLAGAPSLLVTTPGIRPATSGADDQKRVATPDMAIENGADYLVVGRPIIRNADPAAAASHIIADMERGWQRRHAAR